MKSTVLSAQFIKHLQSTFTKRKTGVQNRLPPLSKNWYFPWFEKYTILSLINDYPQLLKILVNTSKKSNSLDFESYRL